MLRTVIEIDKEKCTGCRLCVDACHEGAIGMVEGKACLMRDDFCDGLGDCLPACPTGAITFVKREARPYDEVAVKQSRSSQISEIGTGTTPLSGRSQGGQGCPGARMRTLVGAGRNTDVGRAGEGGQSSLQEDMSSALAQWPVQIKLMPVQAPYYAGCDLLVAADCTAFAYASFHERFMHGKVTVIGCPKLDAGDYGEKLSAIVSANDIRSVTVVRMEVPCCGGLERAVEQAVRASGKDLPFDVVTVSIEGAVLPRG